MLLEVLEVLEVRSGGTSDGIIEPGSFDEPSSLGITSELMFSKSLSVNVN